MSLLPTKPTPIRHNPEDQIIVIYGPPKIGKSTFAAQADGALFLATEAGLNSLEVHQLPITTWPEFGAAFAEIDGGKHSFKTIVIDTIDNLHVLCAKHILAKHGITHESDMSHGKGWAFVKTEFMRGLTALSNLPYGLIMVSHAKDKTMTDPTSEYIKVVPSLQSSISQQVTAMADIILYANFKPAEKGGQISEERVLNTQASKFFDAGDRTGKLPDTMPLDFNLFKKALLRKEAIAS